MMTGDLFGNMPAGEGGPEPVGKDAVILRGFASSEAPALLQTVMDIAAISPFRHLLTPGGLRMSVAMTNAGSLGWVSDRRGYRYQPTDPRTGQPWPPMSQAMLDLAGRGAAAAGFESFVPDVCLINRYVPGARLSLHQDRDEADFAQPIVSISLGIPAIFLLGGVARGERPLRTWLAHGDAVVWGRSARLAYHGVLPLKPDYHPMLGATRINLTFRRAA